MWRTVLLQRSFCKTKVICTFRCPPLAETRLHQAFAQIANLSVWPHNTNSLVTQEIMREPNSFTWPALQLPHQTRAEDWGLAACGRVCQICRWKMPDRQGKGPPPEDRQWALALTKLRWCAFLSTGHWSDDQAVFQLAVTTTSENSLFHCLGKEKPTKCTLGEKINKKETQKNNQTKNQTTMFMSWSRADLLLPPGLQKVTVLRTSSAAEFITTWSYYRKPVAAEARPDGIWGRRKYIFLCLLKEGGKGSLSLVCV